MSIDHSLDRVVSRITNPAIAAAIPMKFSKSSKSCQDIGAMNPKNPAG
jgi:hypothetical protein